MRKIGVLSVWMLCVGLAGCSARFWPARIDAHYAETPAPQAPNYHDLSAWAAHPLKQDPSDSLPSDTMQKAPFDAPIDIFWIHPTIFTYLTEGPYKWNGDVYDSVLNQKVDNSTILYQATIFNQAGRVFAPRYRQANIYAFYTPFKADGYSALQLAYQDVKKSFEVYLEKWNDGRPVMIAAHSQGSVHGAFLVRDFFDNKPLQSKLVAAYLVGMPIPTDSFSVLKPCETPDQTGCLLSWGTYIDGFQPNEISYSTCIYTNPLTWTRSSEYADFTNNKGGVLYKFRKIYPQVASAQIHQGLVWTKRPRFPGSFLFRRKNLHIADYNLYYFNVRENANLRAKRYLEIHQH